MPAIVNRHFLTNLVLTLFFLVPFACAGPAGAAIVINQNDFQNAINSSGPAVDITFDGTGINFSNGYNSTQNAALTRINFNTGQATTLDGSGLTASPNNRGPLLFYAATNNARIFDFSGAPLIISNFKNPSSDSFLNGLGGAVYNVSALTLQGSGSVVFSNNTANTEMTSVYANNNNLSRGGAIGGLGSLYFNNSGSVQFNGNQALLDVSGSPAGYTATDSAQGGAIYASAVWFTGSAPITFDGNKATVVTGGITGDTSSTARGGAIAGAVLGLTNSGAITFNNNIAEHDGAAGAAGNGSQSAWGGAIYGTGNVNLSGGAQFVFTGNQAVAGAAGNGAEMTGSAQGGAVHMPGYTLTLNNASFRQNQATGGGSDNSPGANADNSGLGGAIYTNGTANITGTSFTGNSAAGSAGSNVTSGRGGAIFADAANNTIAINATQSKDVTFSGNTHNPGGNGASPNSIYFGNTQATGNNAAITFNINTDAGSKVIMNDPMASQQDGFTGNAVYSNINMLTINKTGAGEWQLSGTSDMASATAWNVNEGTMTFLAGGDAVHLNNSHAGSSSFNLAGPATLSLQGNTNGSHIITARDISLAGGSTIAVNGSSLINGATLLRLNATNSLSLPGVVTVNTLNLGTQDGTYILVDDNGRGTNFNGKVNALFDGQADHNPLNPRYGDAVYDLTQAGRIIVRVQGADIARNATWDNASGDGLWNETSQNWTLNGSTLKYFKAGDSVIFNGNPDGRVTLDSPHLAVDVMTVGSGSYTFGTNNPAYAISGNRLDLIGGNASFDVSLNFSGINVANGATLQLDPSAQVNAGNSFNLHGALLLVPRMGGHTIHADSINFASGSTVGVTGFGYGPVLAPGSYVALSLESPTVTNVADIPVSTGTVHVGAYDYHYDDLYWNSSGELIIEVGSGRQNPERSGNSAITAPSAIAAQIAPGQFVFNRLGDHFRFRQELYNAPGNPSGNGPEASSGYRNDFQAGSTNLWFLPSYGYTHQTGRSHYDIKTFTLAAGLDRWVSDNVMLGLAVNGALPKYESSNADLDAKHISAALYGGFLLPWQMELGAFAAYGHTTYDQTRRVHGHRLTADYDSNNLGFGFNLGRSFSLDEQGALSLRPFASYEFMRLDVDGYKESSGGYALTVDDHKEKLHFLNAGTGLTYTTDSGGFVTGRVYYAGLYGDRKSEADVHFSADPSNSFTSVGDALDEHSLGLGASASLPLAESTALSLRYNFLAGEDSKTHQINLDSVYTSFML